MKKPSRHNALDMAVALGVLLVAACGPTAPVPSRPAAPPEAQAPAGGASVSPTSPAASAASAQIKDEPTVITPEKTLSAQGSLSEPRGMAVDAAGNLYIADTGNHRLAVLDPSGKLTRSWGKEGTGDGEFSVPEDVAIGPDQKVYVLDSGLARVKVFSTDGQLARVIESASCSPAGLTVGRDGTVFVADTCGSQIKKLSPTGEFMGEYAGGDDPATRLEQPVDVAVGEDGAIYAADLRNRVLKLDPATGAIQKSWPIEVGIGLGGANLAVDGQLLYLTDPERNGLDVIDTKSGQITRFGRAEGAAGQFSLPVGVAVGTDGKIYVLDSDTRRVQVFGNLAPR